MSRRSLQPDTQADLALKQIIGSTPLTSFTMTAGAGSGKTTSLTKGIIEVIHKHGKNMRRRRQRIACVTYTEIAAKEILEEVADSPLAHVSTIHSFLWSLIKSFQNDIKLEVSEHIQERILELRQAAANFGPRVQQKTREKNARDIERYNEQSIKIEQVPSFSYGTGSDYGNGILGHEDIIVIATKLLIERPLLRSLLAMQFPFVFVDESQDTFESVVAALKAVEHQERGKLCLGFFGDPMQKIYLTGVGPVHPEPGWHQITKPENFRCPTEILNVANAIRRDGDGLAQTRGRTVLEGTELRPMTGRADIFILPADEQRDFYINSVQSWAAQQTNDPLWMLDKNVKMLVVVHRMAANRLGFGDLYSALNDKAPNAFKDGFLDGSAWPLRPFINFILPLADAVISGREFEAMQILQAESPLLDKSKLKKADVAALLANVRGTTERLKALMTEGSLATVADVLKLVNESGIYLLDPRIVGHLAFAVDVVENTGTNAQSDDEEVSSQENTAMASYLACQATQFWGYRTYINEESPFSTQQGVKGAQFERVLVVVDDEEGGTHRQFSYDKYFDLKELSKDDRKNMGEGKETSVERTRRLFYVCCTRATSSLVVVVFTQDIELATRKIKEKKIFPEDRIHNLSVLS